MTFGHWIGTKSLTLRRNCWSGDVGFGLGLVVTADDVVQFEFFATFAFQSAPFALTLSPSFEKGVGFDFEYVCCISFDECLELRDLVKAFIVVIWAVITQVAILNAHTSHLAFDLVGSKAPEASSD